MQNTPADNHNSSESQTEINQVPTLRRTQRKTTPNNYALIEKRGRGRPRLAKTNQLQLTTDMVDTIDSTIDCAIHSSNESAVNDCMSSSQSKLDKSVKIENGNTIVDQFKMKNPTQRLNKKNIQQHQLFEESNTTVCKKSTGNIGSQDKKTNKTEGKQKKVNRQKVLAFPELPNKTESKGKKLDSDFSPPKLRNMSSFNKRKMNQRKTHSSLNSSNCSIQTKRRKVASKQDFKDDLYNNEAFNNFNSEPSCDNFRFDLQSNSQQNIEELTINVSAALINSPQALTDFKLILRKKNQDHQNEINLLKSQIEELKKENYSSVQMTDQQTNETISMNKTIEELNTKISEQNLKINKQIAKINEQIVNIDKQNNQINDQTKEIDNLNQQIKNMNEKIDLQFKTIENKNDTINHYTKMINNYIKENESMKKREEQFQKNHSDEIIKVKLSGWCITCLNPSKYYCCEFRYCTERCRMIHWKNIHWKYCNRLKELERALNQTRILDDIDDFIKEADDKSKEENPKDEKSKEENSKEDNSKEDNSKEEKFKNENTNDEKSKEQESKEVKDLNTET